MEEANIPTGDGKTGYHGRDNCVLAERAERPWRLPAKVESSGKTLYRRQELTDCSMHPTVEPHTAMGWQQLCLGVLEFGVGTEGLGEAIT